MTLEWIGQSEAILGLFNTFNYVFALIFILEFIIKIIGYGSRYFKDNWNIFDTVIIILTLAGMVVTFADKNNSYNIGPHLSIIRSFRIARLLQLFKRNKNLKTTFQTFIISFPGMTNIGSLILLIIFIYAILGVYLFAEVKFNGELNENANF